MSNNIDLSNGKTSKVLFKLAIPTILAQLINLLYNIVDRIYIGHMPNNGSLALTGVGLCFAIIIVISAFASLTCAGGAPKAAIAMGQKDNDLAEKIMGTCFSSTIFLSILITIIVLIFAPNMLVLFGASSNTLPYALSYIRIYAIGTIFVMMVLGMNTFITTQGFSKYAMITTAIGALLNIILDPIFIYSFNMGVKGAALATIISQFVSFVWIILFFFSKKTILHLRKEYLIIDKKILLSCLALGIAPFIMQSTEAVLNICFNSSLVKYGGDIAVGSLTIMSSCMSLIQLPLVGLTQGGQPLISYNFGARNNQRVKETFKILFTVCLSFSFVFYLITRLFPYSLANVFTSDKDLIEYTAWSISIYTAGCFALGAQLSCQQSFMALGQAKISLLMACLRKLILLIPLIYILPNLFVDKTFAVFLAEPVSDVLAASVTTFLFFSKFNSILQKGPN